MLRTIVKLSFIIPSVLFAQTQVDYISELKNKPTLDAREYKFTRTNGAGASGNLSVAGGNTVTLTPCPKGVNGTPGLSYKVRIQGGTGTAESVTVTGGTCTSAAASGTLSFTTANTHTGSWVITSISDGIQESICALPAAGGIVLASSTGSSITLNGNISVCGKTSVTVYKKPGITLAGSGTIFNSSTTGFLGSEMAAFISGPATWNISFPNYYIGSFTDIGGYPLAAHHNSDVLEAVSGSINIPSSSTGATAGKGGSFFSLTASTVTAAVGLYSQAGAGANDVTLFGGNILAQMCDGLTGSGHCNGDGSGYSGTRTAVLELNGNNYRTDTYSMVFLNVVGASTRQATNQFDAIAVAGAGAFTYTPYLISNSSLTNITVVSTGLATVTVTTGTGNAHVGNNVEVYGTTHAEIIGEWTITAVLSSTQFQISVPGSIAVSTVYNDAGLICIIEAIRFKNGINVLPGTADIGVNLQEQIGNGLAPSNSTAIAWTANDGTTRWQSRMYGTATGLQAVVSVGKSMTLGDASGAAMWSSSLSVFALGTSTNVSIPVIKATTGQIFVCVSTTGQLVSSATACSGTK